MESININDTKINRANSRRPKKEKKKKSKKSKKSKKTKHAKHTVDATEYPQLRLALNSANVAPLRILIPNVLKIKVINSKIGKILLLTSTISIHLQQTSASPPVPSTSTGTTR